VAPIATGDPRAAWMEKTMSRTNDASSIATHEQHDALAERELDAVTGGFVEQLISTVLKDLHDIRAAIIRNTAV
jgi:hypothetical protein